MPKSSLFRYSCTLRLGPRSCAALYQCWNSCLGHGPSPPVLIHRLTPILPRISHHAIGTQLVWCGVMFARRQLSQRKYVQKEVAWPELDPLLQYTPVPDRD